MRELPRCDVCRGKGGGDAVGLTKPSKGVNILAIVDRHGLPLSVSTPAAKHQEVTLVKLSFDCYMLEDKRKPLIGDRASDSDRLDEDLKQDRMNMMAPHRSTRKLNTQAGRPLRRYQHCRLGERFFAWLQWKRRLLRPSYAEPDESRPLLSCSWRTHMPCEAICLSSDRGSSP